MSRPIRKVLVANRGEIAVRIIRACRELDIRVVAVYSDADRLAAHVLDADEAYHVGPSPSAQSYLVAERIIETAVKAGCDAIHPGYGFLAERAFFAAAVADAGLTFIGPSAGAINAMGDKTEARRRMIAAGVPVVPGNADPLVDAAAAEAVAEEFGYPVLLKAAAGGGGKGMRVVRERAELARAFEAATHEAIAAFGDGSVYLEKYLEQPRHIEIQVLADMHGNTLYLGERDCSVQRRHQKMIEEAPSPAITPEIRARMGEAATAAARAVGYANAGTIEFLFEKGEFFFLEMNTRIQVEHPVTELVTGLDLVQWQIRIAAGERLPFTQADIQLRGHALECRITSEDVTNGFLPSTGRITHLEVPAGPGVRWDGGVLEGGEISVFYDPLVGKLIVYAPDRATAIARMQRALGELRVVGVETSAPFHAAVLAEADFRAGDIDIHYLERHPQVLSPDVPEHELRTAALAAAMLEDARRQRGAPIRQARDTTSTADVTGGDAAGSTVQPQSQSRWRSRGWRP